MPVYIRKNLHIPPPSVISDYREDESDYLADPAQLRDELPQPHRMINKVVNTIFDNCWEIAQARDEQRILEESRIRPPQYDCGTPMELHGTTAFLAASQDGRYVFAGLPDGLAVIDASNQQTVTVWEEEKTEIVQIQTSFLSGQFYILSTVDDMGVARVFAFTGEKVYLLKVMNESQDMSSKVIASKCEASQGGDYIGVALENPSTQETWLEVYRKADTWTKELESLKSQTSKIAPNNPKAPTPLGEETKETETEAVNPPESSGPMDEQGGGESQGTGSRTDSPAQTSDKQQAYKFSPPTLVLKVKAPQQMSYSTANTPYQALSKIDQTGDVIGSGLSHILTAAHVDLRKNVFEHLHEQHMKYLPKEEEQKNVLPSFHFLLPGRMLPVGLEQQSQAGLPTSIAVWWTGGTQLMHYSLIKSAKDVEHKPDLVWPFSCAITSTAVTTDTSMMAVGLENGTVVIMDIRMGIQRRALNITDEAKIKQLKFLNPNICPQEIMAYPPYPVQTACYLMVVSSDGGVSLVNTSVGDESVPITVSERAEDQNSMPSHIETVDGLPEIVFTVYQEGTIFLQDVLKRTKLCEVVLPAGYQLTAPWEPITALGDYGRILFIKGIETESSEEDLEKQSAIFTFPLRSFPVLDDYRKMDREEVPVFVHSRINERLNALLRERITVQPFRQARMQQHWEQMKDELEMLQKIRDQKKEQTKHIYAESTIVGSDEEGPTVRFEL